MSYFNETFTLRTNQLVIIISKWNNYPRDFCVKVLLESQKLQNKIENSLISFI